MRIVELPFELCGGRVPALAFLAAREDQAQIGMQVWLGNGSPAGNPIACTITLPDYVDDSLAIRVNGVWVKDDGLAYTTDNLEHDLFALAAAAMVTLQAGDLVELFAKETHGVPTTTRPWTASIALDDGSSQVFSGGVDMTTYEAGTYLAMGSFRLGFAASTQATSYFQIASLTRFATPAILLAEYDQSRPTIDDVGPLVHLTGVDNELDDADAFRALAAESLIFIGDEVMTLSGATLVAPNTYRLQVLRQRFGTRKATHANGAEVWMIARSDLQPVTYAAFTVGNSYTFKVTRIGSRFSADLANVDPVAHSFTGQSFAPSPRNLRINGQSPAIVDAAAGFTATWSLPANIDASGEGDWKYATRIRFVVDDDVEDERTVHTTSVSYTAAELADFLGVATSFRLEICTIAESDEIRLASLAETLNATVI